MATSCESKAVRTYDIGTWEWADAKTEYIKRKVILKSNMKFKLNLYIPLIGLF